MEPENLPNMALPFWDRLVGRIQGHMLDWLMRRAAERGDWHERNHCYMALLLGNSNHGVGPCMLPPQFRDKAVQVTVGTPDGLFDPN